MTDRTVDYPQPARPGRCPRTALRRRLPTGAGSAWVIPPPMPEQTSPDGRRYEKFRGSGRLRRATRRPRIRAALGCDLRHVAPAPAVARRVEPRAQPLRLGPGALGRSRRAGRRVAGGLAVLQPQPRGVAPADPPLPGHQPGAVRAAGAAGRAGHRPTPARAAQHRRLPVRAARRVRRRVGADAARPRLLLLRAGAADRRQGDGRDAPGARPGPRRRQHVSSSPPTHAWPAST